MSIDLLHRFGSGNAVEIDHAQSHSALLDAAQRHSRDIYIIFAENVSNRSDNARLVAIFENQQYAFRIRFDRFPSNADNPRNIGRPDQSSGSRSADLTILESIDLNQLRIIALLIR